MVGVEDGNDHTIALKGDGTVWTWGANASGQIGDGTTTHADVSDANHVGHIGRRCCRRLSLVARAETGRHSQSVGL